VRRRLAVNQEDLLSPEAVGAIQSSSSFWSACPLSESIESTSARTRMGAPKMLTSGSLSSSLRPQRVLRLIAGDEDQVARVFDAVLQVVQNAASLAHSDADITRYGTRRSFSALLSCTVWV